MDYGILSHMLDGRILLEDGVLLEVNLDRRLNYRLRYGGPEGWRVTYENGVRRIGARASAYAFRSVEQLRYDFERDVEEA
jgi:hypothetical protein